MKVIVITSQSDINFTRESITNGKVYDVVSTNRFKSKPGISHYRIINDKGSLQSFYHTNFETLRDINLKKLLQ